MPDNGTIRVAIVEDDDDMRITLQRFIDNTSGFSCTGAFESCEEALSPIESEGPDVILMDINLPGMSGIDGVRRIKLFDPHANILMLTVYQDDDNIFRSICAGASGYLLKRTPKDVLLNAIREVHAGGAPMNAGIARRVMELFRKTAAPTPAESSLTDREIEILQSLVDGCSYKMIADRHNISIETVRNHIKHIYEKLHVHSKSEAVAKALKERLV
ncbi:MAG: response regulator transcription factor [Ignavibacteria bacterium]|nr:response regulator transcription factor [Ignavibacteria bacterium]MBI3766792.1 response regulator transcription factor [Ignavibacteriales bacterium]